MTVCFDQVVKGGTFMEPVILKQNMTEEDIKLQYITPCVDVQMGTPKDHYGDANHRW